MTLRLPTLLVATIGLFLGGAFLAGCSAGSAAVRPDGPPTPLKEYNTMTKDEKIAFINKTPMPEDAKRKQIAAIQAGTDK